MLFPPLFVTATVLIVYCNLHRLQDESDSDDSRLGPPVLSSSSSNNSNGDDDDDERAERVSHGSDSDSDNSNDENSEKDPSVGFFLTEFDHRNPTDFHKDRKARKPGRLAQGEDEEEGDAKNNDSGGVNGDGLMHGEGEAEARYNDCVKLQVPFEWVNMCV